MLVEQVGDLVWHEYVKVPYLFSIRGSSGLLTNLLDLTSPWPLPEPYLTLLLVVSSSKEVLWWVGGDAGSTHYNPYIRVLSEVY